MTLPSGAQLDEKIPPLPPGAVLDPAPSIPPPPPGAVLDTNELGRRSFGRHVGDVGAALGGGLANLAGDISWLVDVTSPVDMSGITEKAGEAADFFQGLKSDQLKESYEKLGQADGFIESMAMVGQNPNLIPDMLIGSLPYLLPAGGVAKVTGAGRAGVAAVSATGGILEGANAAREAEGRVDEMTPEMLAVSSESYKGLIDSGLTPDQAKEMIRKRTGLTTFAFTAPVATLASVLSGSAKLEADFFTGGATRNVVSAVAKEGGEEIIQEGANALGGNIGVRVHADPEQDLREGVGQAAAMGLVAGGAQGGGLRLAGSLISRNKISLDQIGEETPEQTASRLGAELQGLEAEIVEAEANGMAPEDIQLYRDAYNEIEVEFARAKGIDPSPLEGELLPAAEEPLQIEDQNIIYQGRDRKTVDGESNLVDVVETNKSPLVPTAEELDAQANEAATSPLNALPLPTPAQEESGDYQKGKVSVLGYDIEIENPRYSLRSGVDEDGSKWETSMAHHYGDIVGTVGADGDPVDVFVGENLESQKVFIVDQLDKDGSFDEHKVLMGFDNLLLARKGYQDNYDEGFTVGPITEMSVDEFKTWTERGDTTLPISQTLSGTPLKQIELTEKMVLESSGEEVEVTQTADVLISEIDSRIDSMKSLLNCVRG